MQEHGFRVTSQRLNTYQVFRENEHLNAEDVFLRVRKIMPLISLATVYAILEHFEVRGLIREVRIDPTRVFYEMNKGEHCHFLCRVCHAIYDVHVSRDRMKQLKSVDGHTVEDFQGYFYGVCEGCCEGNEA